MTPTFSQPPLFFNAKVDRVFAWAALAGSLVFLLAFGVFGLLRSAPLGLDFGVFYRAAEVFIAGGNPWRDLVASGDAFAYPPHTASLLALCGFLSHDIALALHTGLNLLAIAVLAWLANRWFIGIDSARGLTLPQGAALALLIGNPFMAHSVFEGQIALPAVAFVLLSWHFFQLGRWLPAGIFLGLATIKPQVSLIYIVWLVLLGQWRILFSGAATAALLLLPALIAIGPVEAFVSWKDSFAFYKTVPANIPGSFHVVGLRSALAAIGWDALAWLSPLLACAAVAALFVRRAHYSATTTVLAFLVIALTFIYGHDTDYAVAVMAFALMLWLAMQGGWCWRLMAALVLCAVFFFPQRFLRELPYPLLHHTRTFVLPLCWLLIALWQKQRR